MSDTTTTVEATVDWHTLISYTKISDFVLPQLITANVEDTIADTLLLLKTNQILSVPVIDNGNVVGLIDLMDIIGFLLKSWNEKYLQFGAWDDTFPSGSFLCSIGTIMNFSMINPLACVSDDSSILDLITSVSMSQYGHRIHRVLVRKNGMIVGLISQRDIVKFACLNIEYMPVQLLNKSIGDLGLYQQVAVIQAEDDLKNGLMVLYQNRFSGVALIDIKSRLIGGLGLEDFRDMNVESTNYFLKTILEYLTHSSHLNTVVTCTEATTFRDLLGKFFTYNPSRIFVTNEDNMPIGIISFGDVIAALNQE